MVDVPRAVTWEAPEHHHIEKSSDWFWALGILGVAGTVAAIMFGNLLFGILIAIATLTLGMVGAQEPKIIPHAITARGIRLGDQLYPYSTLDSFYIDEDNPRGVQLLVKSQRTFMPLLIMPIPEEYQEEIEALLETRLEEEELEEPLFHKIMEILGF